MYLFKHFYLYLFLTNLVYASQTISHNGLEYGTITSETTGKVWLDRNLGASKACETATDKECYGDYYQWGRPTDGHEKATSQETDILSNSLSPGHDKFIKYLEGYIPIWTNTDETLSQRSKSWNPCPNNFKVPTIEDLVNEDITIQNAFSNLKLAKAGHRSYYDFENIGTWSRLWTSTAVEYINSNFKPIFFYVSPGDIKSFGANSGHGYSVRCIENTTEGIKPTKEKVTKLYVATFNRAPDSEGIDYWINQSSLSLSQIAMSFFEQKEIEGKYPEIELKELEDIENQDNEIYFKFINNVYLNMFNREATYIGLEYWSDSMIIGSMSRNRFIEAVINGAQDSTLGQDKTILNNKTEVGLAFAEAGLGINDFPAEVIKGVTVDYRTVDFIKERISSKLLDFNMWDDFKLEDK